MNMANYYKVLDYESEDSFYTRHYVEALEHFDQLICDGVKEIRLYKGEVDEDNEEDEIFWQLIQYEGED